ncbi:thioredoxin [Nanoarchaeota archaeon]
MNLETKENFEKAIQEGKTLVDFYADWCGPCQRVGPIIEKLSEEYKDVKFIKANVDESKELATKFGVMSIPCLVFIKDGKEVDRIVGAASEEVLKEKLDAL